MDLRELESYRLSDAIKFNDDLNPRLWGSDEHLLPEVREKLMAIADDFREFLGITDLEIKDITISGSNAAYTYTPHSDIDLHLVVDLPRADASDVYRELFDAKKYQYNDQHDYKIGGYDVELYVQNANQPHVSQGIYSVLNNDWIKVPARRKPTVDDISVKSKYEDIGQRIEQAIKSDDLEKMDALARKIREMRQAGLETTGEFGPENLAFKVLRGNGTLEKLRDARMAAKDARMSLDERKKKKKKKKTKYGYGAYWFPGYHYYGQTDAATDGGADAGGGDGGGGESIREDAGDRDPYEVFAEYVCKELGIDDCPQIKIRRDPQWSRVNGTFGRYDPSKNTLEISVAGRHMADVMRTLAHELVHHHQEEREGIPADGGKTGSRFEDEANAVAGRIMRDFREQHPEIFANRLEEQLDRPTPTPEEIMRKHGMNEADFVEQLRQGMKVEMEHTKNARTAMEIALDHINELPDYYTRLAKMEKGVQEAIQTPVSQDPKHIKQYYDFVQAKARMGRPLTKAEQQFLTSYHAVMKMKGQVAEGALSKALLAAVFAAAASFVKAQEPEVQPQEPVTAAKILNAARWIYGASQLRAPGVKEEFTQEFKNWLRRQGGHTDQPTRLPIPDIRQPGEQPVNEATGYIPINDKEAKDPRYSMAITQDIKPGEVQRQAAKMGFKTDAAGVPPLLMKKLNNLLESVKTDEDCWSGYRQAGMKKKGDRMVPNCVPVEEDEELMEVEMSPSAFRKFLNSDAAKGIRAGFEAELIFRDTKSNEDDDEYEADYDADERAYSIESVIDFFQGGDGIGRNAANRLRNSMYEDWTDWQRDSFYNDYWDENVYNDWVQANIWPGVEDEYMDRAREELGEDSEDTAVEELARENFETDRHGDFESQGEWYQQAEEESWDEYRENDASEEDWLSENYRWMSDISNAYELDWPYYRGSDGNDGSRDWDEIGSSLERATGLDVKVSSGYHQALRKENQYVLEPDSSLDPDSGDDFGLEVVSPPLPLPEAIDQLKKVIDWANGSGDAYTNTSTGIHMGVSLPFKGGDVDPIKLILFMGDKDLLEKFDREGNHYARSAYDRLESKIRGMKNAGPKQIQGVMELMKKNLIELADRELKRGVLGDKYVSVNPHDGYIEFRGPGGDYLAKESEIDGILENTMLRLAYAMSIAGRPDLYRKEYAKKLYKVLSGYKGAEISKDPKSIRYQTKIETEDENPFMRLFADYSAGFLSGDELKRQWADTVLRAEQDKDEEEDIPPFIDKDYDVYDPDTGKVISVFHADDDEAAIKYFNANFRPQNPTWKVRVHQEPKKPKAPASRRAELAKRVTRSTRDVGEQLWRVNHHSSFQYVIANSQAEAVEKAVQKDRAFDSAETRARIATDAERTEYQQRQELEQLRRQQQVSDAAPRADFEIYDSSNNNRVVATLQNATADRVREAIRSYESEHGGYAPGVLRVRQV